jgi:hypothetical protein
MTARRTIARSSAALLAGVLASAGLAAAPAHGAVISQRIIGGALASAGSWSSIASVEARYTNATGTFVASCGGTVIAPHWVVTADHCVYGDGTPMTPEQMTVTTGRQNLSSTAQGQVIGVTQIIRNPGYAPSRLGQDIALLRLATATSATPMRVATQAAVASYRSPAGVPNTAGWGLTSAGANGEGSLDLKETYIPLRDNADCVTALAPIGTFEPSNMVCAGAGGPTATTTCHGDSGGPLVVFDGGTPVLWGLTTWGAPACDGGITAFTRVAAFESFLAPALAELTTAPAPAPAPAAPAPAPAAPAPARPAAPAPAAIAPAAARDTLAPVLSHFRIPATVFVRRGRATRPLTVQLHSSERATVRITLLRRSGRVWREQRRLYQARLSGGTSRMTLPRSLWHMSPGSYRLRIQAADVAGNTRAVMAAIRARRG